jgi:hypothetical protein
VLWQGEQIFGSSELEKFKIELRAFLVRASAILYYMSTFKKEN